MPGLLALLTRMKLTQDLIVLTECWLSCNPNIPNIEGYVHYFSSTTLNQNDGVVVYVRSSIVDVTVTEPVVVDANCILIRIGRDMGILAIYRSPSIRDINNFLHSIDLILTNNISLGNIIVVGDINIDIAEGTMDGKAEDYLNLLASHGLLPAHNLSTRGKSSLDHIILKTKLNATTLVIESTVTDHHAAMLVLTNFRTFNTRNSKTKIDHSQLENYIQTLDYSYIYNCSNVNLAFEHFSNSLSRAIQMCSIMHVTPCRLRIIKPWITPGVLRCMRNRDRMYKKIKTSPNNEILKTTFKRYRNYCNNLLKNLKLQYERDMISKAKSDPKKLWSAIKKVTHIGKTCSTAADLLKVGTSPDIAVNVVNNFFVSVGKNLSTQVAGSSYQNKPLRMKNADPCNSMVLLETDEEEIMGMINTLRADSATGIDGISPGVLKQYKSLLIRPITYLVNLCLSSGVFPNIFKKALVHPIHKSGERDRINNYRPISVLPAMSKILEKIINIRLKKFLETNNLLSNRQFGFRNDRSTDDAVHDLTNHIVKALDNREKCVAIFLDLAKAFDTVSVHRLCSKLERLGIRGKPLELFKSYLTNRTQCVKIGDHLSEELTIEHGVPQGSILGPTLFLTYINDMCSVDLVYGKLVAYADDTALIFTASTWEQTFQAAQVGFDSISTWLSDNLLSLNISKTKFMKFSIYKQNSFESSLYNIVAHNHAELSDLVCDCPYLETSSTIKYLGVTLDENLNFRSHTQNLSGRIRKLCYVFKHLRHVTEPGILKMVYYALCQSLLSYCITAWGGSSKTHFLTIERAQRAVLKVCTFKPFRFPTRELYEYCEVLTVRQLFVLQTVLRQHTTGYNISLASYLRNSRRVNVIPRNIVCKTSFSQKFFYFLGPFLYNKTNNILAIYQKNKYVCKKIISKWLLNLSYDETENLLQPVK